MCGIAGWLHYDKTDIAPTVVGGMIEKLHHRGPDWQDVHNEQKISLAHARLSILDLSPAGHQPMMSADGRFVMVYNGEIYNFPEIKKRLVKQGHVFRGTGDSEVILAAFAQWGTDAFAQWNGMFAAAFWDNKTEKLTFVRDQHGVKPLYIGQFFDHSIAFASELGAFHSVPGFSKTIRPQAVAEYLEYGAPLGGKSFFDKIDALQPGHFMEVDATGVRITPFVSPLTYDCDPNQDPNPDWKTAQSQLRDHLQAAVSRQMVSDVPVGVFLSGGLDSSAIAALAAQSTDKKISTFSIAFGQDKDSGELPIARETSLMIGSDHTEIFLSGADVPEMLEAIVSSHGEPFGDPASLPVYQMSGAIHPFAKVVLQGDGGDEVFGGYDRYTRLTHYKRLKALGALSPFAGFIGRAVPKVNRAFRTVAAFNEKDENQLFARLMSQDGFRAPSYDILSTEMKAYIGQKDAGERYREVSNRLGHDHKVQKMMRIDRRVILPDVYFPKVDRASMAQSIETRVPMMDNDLVRFMGGLDAKFKTDGKTTKILLRETMKNSLPASVFAGAKKGFDVPQRQWLRKELTGYFYETMQDVRGLCEPLFDFERIEALSEQHKSYQADHGMLLYKLLVFFVWVRQMGSVEIKRRVA